MASWQEVFVPYVVSIYLLTGELFPHLGNILKEPNSVNFKDMSFIDSWCHISTTGDWPGVTNPPQWILYVRSSYVGGVAFSALLFQTSIKKRTPLLTWWIASFAHMIPPIHIPNLDILVSNLTSALLLYPTIYWSWTNCDLFREQFRNRNINQFCWCRVIITNTFWQQQF